MTRGHAAGCDCADDAANGDTISETSASNNAMEAARLIAERYEAMYTAGLRAFN